MHKLIGGIVVLVAITLVNGPTLTPFAAAQTKPKDPTTQKDKGAKKDATQPATSLTVEIYKDASGEFRFRIKDGDTMLAISGKGYDDKPAVTAVIDKLKMNMGAAKVVDHSADTPTKAKAKDKDK